MPAFKEILAVEIEAVPVLVFGPLLFERLCFRTKSVLLPATDCSAGTLLSSQKDCGYLVDAGIGV